mmetsp:Transcript_48798/g.95397  ORF Transcript_48798/g.95397 Transcript_48798/m.95397 type:complete len:283 (-) Transcript_48798:66-914(-)|eukprot:CAMPEP_0194327828 /NCGR_PEP_ID=MMETSP0171-20130528/42597_1 /TAXON_ID=218684 /ORGANISM="Corethron pennatum, Strain L29A3" /LENGTH=282 /DNA_ID=CAMNT_0039087909 /DNA_START=105 /DNA_END=953 /DNA_ORIENTATION=+
MTALTRSKRLSSQLKGENLCKKDIAQSSSVPEARGRFLAVAESALSDLINTGYSRKNAVIVLTEMISVGGLPSDNEIFDLMNRSGLVRDEALRALTVSKALKELRSCQPKSVCDVASIDALSNLIDKKCDIRTGKPTTTEKIPGSKVGDSQHTFGRPTSPESSSCVATDPNERPSAPLHCRPDLKYAEEHAALFSSKPKEKDLLTHNLSRGSSTNKRNMTSRNEAVKVKLGQNNDPPGNLSNITSKIDENPVVLSKTKSPPLKTKRGNGQPHPPSKRSKNNT